MRAGLFPGQGIPAAAVLQAIPENDPLVERAQVKLGYPLRRRVAVSARREGALLPTELAQPAIFVASMRAFDEMSESGERFDFFAGHSLGEYAALVAAGALRFEDALEVVRVRGEAMRAAARRFPGGMAAVVGLELDKVIAIAEESGVEIANDNAPDQVVLAGPEQGLAAAARLVSEIGARSVLLEVSGPFHTNAIGAAAEPLREALDAVEVGDPSVAVVSNVTARPYEDAEDIRSQLVAQLTSRVRWRESVEHMWAAGVETFTDFGPGKIVGPLAQKTVRSLKRQKEVPAGV